MLRLIGFYGIKRSVRCCFYSTLIIVFIKADCMGSVGVGFVRDWLGLLVEFKRLVGVIG